MDSINELARQALEAKEHWFKQYCKCRQQRDDWMRQCKKLEHEMADLSGRYIALKAKIRPIDNPK